MEYTEQQKKDYQELRRTRYEQKQAFLKSKRGKPISNERLSKILANGNTERGKVFENITKNRPVRNLKGFAPLF